jgi:hypothetical protein
MTREEREAFLADVHVGVLSVADTDGRPPLAIPMWYSYVPGGELRVVTWKQTRKLRLIRAAGRFSLCVQTESLPYKYVTVEGPVVSIDFPVDPAVRHALAARYVGAQGADAYIASTPDAPTNAVLVRMLPEHWITADFARRWE